MDSLHIEITGGKDSGKTVVANVIHEALSNAGFKTVTQIDETGDTITPAFPEPKTILDLVRHDRPQLFDTPVTISETTWAGDDDTVGIDEGLNRLEAEANNEALAEVA